MKPKILSWNVRGINDVNKHLRIRSLLRSWKINIVCLQETKLSFIDRNIIHSLWGCSFVGCSYLASLGASGGVLLIWDKRVGELVEECIGNYLVPVLLKILGMGGHGLLRVYMGLMWIGISDHYTTQIQPKLHTYDLTYQ
ncbi:hypothetical protein CIPAW_03G092400 [Carya illinoinensis]|uniref:Endonuclease/exonuclease/phosphatase domain-containing protein n=1 Tax=Carya illinoinensis TaxID=32201 RepID=A0A8T1R245_CARIL|nr:hypothetical protein CIPAW_03G092400 [Carya illinoinensis]